MDEWTYCPLCGKNLEHRHDGEKEANYCVSCGRFFYRNPIPCVAAVLETAEGILLIRRGKEPKAGWWALPGGFLDIGESPEEGARRELLEETGVHAPTLGLIGLTCQHSDRFGSVIYAGYEVMEHRGVPSPSSDAADARFFPRGHLPPIAFDSLEDLLLMYFRMRHTFPGS